MTSKIFRGTIILTIGMVLSKIIGLFYIIPFTTIVGNKGNELYSYGYIPYTIFLSIATGVFRLPFQNMLQSITL